MKILSLRADDFARLKAVEIRPDGALVPITGKNSAGKSTVLKAIWTALEGRAAAPAKPIREGAERAVIKLDLGEFNVTRSFRKDKHGEVTSDLTVTLADGSAVKRTPQAMIDAVLGDLTFDPLAFSKLPPKEQFERLKKLVPGVDFEAIASQRQRLYDERTDANREHRSAAARSAAIQLPPGPEPREVNVDDLLEEIHVANQRNQSNQRLRDAVDAKRAKTTGFLVEADSLRRQADRFEATARALHDEATKLGLSIDLDIDTADFAKQLSSARQVEIVRRQFKEKRECEIEAARAKDVSEDITDKISAIDIRVENELAKAKLPAGLSLDAANGAVLLQGLPFASAGTADKIIASAQAAMAMNPKLRVMLIDEGSELDAEHVEMLAELAEAHDYQVWVCSVSNSADGPGFRIEDGSVAT